MNRTGNTWRAQRLWPTAAAVLALAPSAGAAVTWDITVDDTGSLAFYAEDIEANLAAAAAEWSRHLLGSGSIEVVVELDSGLSTASGRSATSTYVGHNGSYHVWEQGMAGEIRTGVDPNGAAHDVEINLSPTYLAHELWFDPDPTSGSALVPPSKTDAYSIFLHEIGHALGFNGWRSMVTGALGTYGSTFDELTTFNGVDFFFEGARAMTVYGGPVPLTRGNIFHVGNHYGRPGWDLREDLMSGVIFERGRRYRISQLNLAMMADMGVPIDFAAVPTPSATALAALALGAVAPRRRRAPVT